MSSLLTLGILSQMRNPPIPFVMDSSLILFFDSANSLSYDPNGNQLLSPSSDISQGAWNGVPNPGFGLNILWDKLGPGDDFTYASSLPGQSSNVFEVGFPTFSTTPSGVLGIRVRVRKSASAGQTRILNITIKDSSNNTFIDSFTTGAVTSTSFLTYNFTSTQDISNVSSLNIEVEDLLSGGGQTRGLDVSELTVIITEKAKDISGNSTGREGTLIGAASYNSTNSGVFRLTSGATNGRIDITPNLTSFASSSAHTYFAFIKIDSFTAANYVWVINNGSSTTGTSLIVQKNGGDTTRGGVAFFYNGGNNFSSSYTLSTQGVPFNDVPQLSQGAWHSIAVVYDGSLGVKFYLDGALLGNLSVISFSSGNLNPRIGAWQNEAFPLFGDIPVTAVYSRALTDNEIAQNHNAFKGRYGL